MTREINRAENWESVYEAFQQINFTAFDYNSVKQNLIDYIKLYFPERFSDFIESSELIAIVECFAYITELLSYRVDVNAHENFILTAQRKQSILRLAKLISYNPSRNVPARGLVKLTSISTTESVFDSRGTNLANTTIRWNDQNNPNWKEQFFLVINKILRQEVGTVDPGDRIQVDDVLFELYELENKPLSNGVISYSVTADGLSFPMELVPSALNEFGPYERRPTNNSVFSFLYGSDGLGDSSNTTGFFCFTKQGTLQKTTAQFDGITPNQTFDINIDNINETDVWVNQIDPNTLELINSVNFDALNRNLGLQGEWNKVDIENGQNVVFNTNLQRNKYEIETLEDDQIRLVFGDGEFSDIPSGTFEVWYRTSANQDVVIPQIAASDVSANFDYVDSNSSSQSFTFTFSFINSLTNGASSEDIENIRRVAPSRYYTQDRMVNGRDHNVFPLQDITIKKVRTVNRTFAGDSNYITWHDPSGTYENVKIFGNDLAVYFNTDGATRFGNPNTQAPLDFVVDVVEPVLSEVGLLVFHLQNDLALPTRELTVTQRADLVDRIDDAENTLGPLYPIYLQYSYSGTEWEWIVWDLSQSGNVGYPTEEEVSVIIDRTATSWTVYFKDTRINVESPSTRFWIDDPTQSTVNIDTLNSTYDQIILLQANVDATRQSVLSSDLRFNIIGNESSTVLPNTGLPNITKLNVIPVDTNFDGVPDNISLSSLLNQTYVETNVSNLQVITLPFTYVNGYGEIEVRDNITGDVISWTSSVAIGDESNEITIDDSVATFPLDIKITLKDFIFLSRLSTSDEFALTDTTLEIKRAWYSDGGSTLNNLEKDLYRRFPGRSDLNFAWFHSVPQFNIIDPAPSNIHDMIIITKGYFTEHNAWLNGTGIEPTLPTSLQLRTDYSQLLTNKMLSDEIILKPGKFKVFLGPKASDELRAKIIVVRSRSGSLTNNEVKVKMVSYIKQFFDIDSWEFGETFYFSELSALLHSRLPTEIDSIALVPLYGTNAYGDLSQINVREDEIIQADISINDIEIVEFLNRDNLRQCN